MKMFGGVLVLRRIATTDISADKTEPQVNPSITHLYAFFANVLGGRPDFDLVEVGAAIVHMISPNTAAFRSSDFSHLTKVQPLRKVSQSASQWIAEVFHTCWALIIFVLIIFLAY
jgi:hypothetical protein